MQWLIEMKSKVLGIQRKSMYCEANGSMCSQYNWNEIKILWIENRFMCGLYEWCNWYKILYNNIWKKFYEWLTYRANVNTFSRTSQMLLRLTLDDN